jgi:hypothetical protein
MARERVGSAVFATVELLPSEAKAVQEAAAAVEEAAAADAANNSKGEEKKGKQSRHTTTALFYDKWKALTRGTVLAAVDRLLHSSGLSYEKTPDRAPMMRTLVRVCVCVCGLLLLLLLFLLLCVCVCVF